MNQPMYYNAVSVLSPKQNIEISQMARRYNAGTQLMIRRGVALNITNQINVQGSENEQSAQLIGYTLRVKGGCCCSEHSK